MAHGTEAQDVDGILAEADLATFFEFIRASNPQLGIEERRFAIVRGRSIPMSTERNVLQPQFARQPVVRIVAKSSDVLEIRPVTCIV